MTQVQQAVAQAAQQLQQLQKQQAQSTQSSNHMHQSHNLSSHSHHIKSPPSRLLDVDETTDLEELETFAKTFKQRRIKLGRFSYFPLPSLCCIPLKIYKFIYFIFMRRVILILPKIYRLTMQWFHVYFSFRFYARRRRPRHGKAVRKRLFPNDHLEV